MIRVFRLYQSIKEIDLIWVILKESKSWREKKRKKTRFIAKKISACANTNIVVNKYMIIY